RWRGRRGRPPASSSPSRGRRGGGRSYFSYRNVAGQLGDPPDRAGRRDGGPVLQPDNASSYFASDESTPGWALRELHRSVVACSSAFATAREAARFSLCGRRVDEGVPVSLVFRLEGANADVDEHRVAETFGPRSAHH